MTIALPTFSPGTQLYKYHLISWLGQGSFGQVWHAVDRALNREYAIKILNPGLTVDERLREARIGHTLAHNNLIKIHQADVVNMEAGDLVILAMDKQANGSAEKLANPAGYLPLPDALRLSRDILQGLDYLHANNFFHNDIKPGNILLGSQGQGILSDYGITGVSAKGEPATATASYVLHRAPEVVSCGQIDVATDIFQVGMTLYRMLVGLSSLSAKQAQLGPVAFDAALANGTLITRGDFPDHIPSMVRRIVLKAIHPNTEERFKSSLDMRRQLEGLNFRGFWSVDPTGAEIGQCPAYHYRFAVTYAGAGLNDIRCEKTNRVTGVSRRISKFCKTGLNQKQLDQEIKSIKIHVVEGK